jgi:Ca2+-binding EF-hand superfamily protein
MLSPLQKQKLTRYFRVYDIDDDGTLGRPDFDRVLENLRVLHGLSDGAPRWTALRQAYLDRWEAVRRSADVDEDGGVDLTEWLAYWADLLADGARYQAEVSSLVDRLYALFDTDEDGVIGADEFCDFYGAFGLRAELAREVFHGLDRDGNGSISRSEFYRSDDPGAPGNQLYGSLEG